MLAIGGLTASPGVSPAGAADTLRGTDLEVPVPLPAPIRADSDPVPDPSAGGGEANPTTIPLSAREEPSPSGDAAVAPSSSPEGAGPADSGDRAGTTSRARTRARTTTAPRPGDLAPTAPAVAVVDHDDGDATVERLRDASVPAARQFGLPLVLGAMVLAFLAVQGRVDRRDAKLMAAPVTVADDLLPFA